MKPQTITAGALLLSLLPLAHSKPPPGYTRAIRLSPSIHARQQSPIFTGGWGLRTTGICPANTQKCTAVGPTNCCPTSSTCVHDNMIGDNYIACCPEGTDDCVSMLKSLPVCADPRWVLWRGPNRIGDEPFCCQEGEIGYVTIEGRSPGACGPEDIDIDATQRATTLRPATARRSSTPTGPSQSTPTKDSDGDPYPTNPNSNEEDPTDEPEDPASGGSRNRKTTSSSGLSKGALIGIIAGVVVLLIFAAILAFVCFRRVKKSAFKAGLGAASGYGDGQPAGAAMSKERNGVTENYAPVKTGGHSPAVTASTVSSPPQYGWQQQGQQSQGYSPQQQPQQSVYYQLDHTARPPLAEAEGDSGVRR